jgi:hypothetical protein
VPGDAEVPRHLHAVPDLSESNGRAPGTPACEDARPMEQLPFTELPSNDEKPPFQWDARHVEAWLRSNDPKRDELIIHQGVNIRTYPASRREGAETMFNANSRYCSNLTCRKTIDDCIHAVEDDFRFGRFKGKAWVPPARQLRINGSGKLERTIPRPNPTIGNVKAATIARRARRNMEGRGYEIASQLAKWLRMECERTHHAEFGRVPRAVGRPSRDSVDIAVAAAMRFYGLLTYDDLAFRVRDWHERGILKTVFDQERVVEEMNRTSLSDVERRKGLCLIGPLIDKMTDKMHGMFRNVADTFVMDGITFSTAETDNPRKGRLTEGGPVQVELHVIYEINWGLITGYRVTWAQRGAGSGESPQLPYALAMTKDIFDPKILLADRAYSHDYNFYYCDQVGVKLHSPIKDKSWDPKTKKYLDEDTALAFFREYNQANPGIELSITYPFRNRVEGWNQVLREQTGRGLISRPDLASYPLTKEQWKKENPDTQYIELPEDPTERNAFIVANQRVGVAVENEFRARRFSMALRGLIHAEGWYNQRFDPFALTDRAFDPIPQDQARSIYRLPGSQVA